MSLLQGDLPFEKGAALHCLSEWRTDSCCQASGRFLRSPFLNCSSFFSHSISAWIRAQSRSLYCLSFVCTRRELLVFGHRFSFFEWCSLVRLGLLSPCWSSWWHFSIVKCNHGHQFWKTLWNLIDRIFHILFWSYHTHSVYVKPYLSSCNFWCNLDMHTSL